MSLRPQSFFFVGSYTLNDAPPNHPFECTLLPLNEATLPKKRTWMEVGIPAGVEFLLDSGTYSLVTQHAREHGMSPNAVFAMAPSEIDGFDGLKKTYIEFMLANKDRLWGYIEIDLGGPDSKRAIRRELEALGLEPIPVWHWLTDGYEYFDELAMEYERICIGNIAQGVSRKARLMIMLYIQLRRKQMKGKFKLKWLHALGLGTTPQASAMGYESADSTRWLQSMIFRATAVASALATTEIMDGDAKQYRRGDPDSAILMRQLSCADTTVEIAAWRHLTDTIGGQEW